MKQQAAGRPRSLPVIIPVVLYHGGRKWGFGDTFSNLFENTEPALSDFIPDFKYALIDLTRYADDEIRGAVLSRVAMLLFKYVSAPDFVEKLPGILSLLKDLSESENGLTCIEKFIRYLFSAIGNMSPGELKTIVERSAMKEKGELVMNMAEQLINEGFQKGIKEGVLLGKIEMALSLKFGDTGMKMMDKIRDIGDAETLKFLSELAQTADNLADIDKLLRSRRS